MKRPFAKEVEIQQYDTSTEKWKTVPLTKIVNNEDKAIVAPSFRVLVGGNVVYREFGFNAIKPRFEGIA